MRNVIEMPLRLAIVPQQRQHDTTHTHSKCAVWEIAPSVDTRTVATPNQLAPMAPDELPPELRITEERKVPRPRRKVAVEIRILSQEPVRQPDWSPPRPSDYSANSDDRGSVTASALMFVHHAIACPTNTVSGSARATRSMAGKLLP